MWILDLQWMITCSEILEGMFKIATPMKYLWFIRIRLGPKVSKEVGFVSYLHVLYDAYLESLTKQYPENLSGGVFLSKILVTGLWLSYPDSFISCLAERF